jgi:predicted dehydrogenase
MPEGGTPLRVGLVGTGYWATVTHAPALSSTAGIELAAIWGRDAAAAGALAASHGAVAFGDVDEMIEAVDVVAFSVPPSVQCSMALRAAKAGRHLLLEKPIALSLTDADALVHAVEESGVASVVFFTSLFQPAVRTWLTEIGLKGGWMGGSGAWLATVLSAGNPFNTPWRQEKGALWDVGPHAVGLLWSALGPVVSVCADAGRGDLVHLVLHHVGGATSTVTLTLGAPEAAAGVEFSIWGESGRSVVPLASGESLAALRVAGGELAALVCSGGVAHACDVRFGRDVVGVLSAAGRQIAANSPA